MNIIAVDDEYLSRLDLEWAIRAAIPGAELLSFDDPFSALEFAKESHVDIAYLDIKMPEMNGLELARQLRELRPDVNIIFSTGHGEYALDAFSVYACGYLLKPITEKAVSDSLKGLRFNAGKLADMSTDKSDVKSRLRVQCFGNFDVFVDGERLLFPRQKAKELFAYLVHKRGTSCATQEICSILYKNFADYSSPDKQVQTQISALMATFRDIGFDDVVVRKRNSLAVDPKKIDCDYYRLLDKEPDAVDLYTGEYMENYSWAEFKTDILDSAVDKK